MLKFQVNTKQVPVIPVPDSKDQPRAVLVLEGFLGREELARAFGLSTRTLDALGSSASRAAQGLLRADDSV